jgi:hypothetical protein
MTHAVRFVACGVSLITVVIQLHSMCALAHGVRALLHAAPVEARFCRHPP